MEKKRLVFISNMAAPYQVKFCYALQEYFDVEFWFFVRREPDRPKWWEIPLGESCKVLKFSGSAPVVGYYSLGIFSELQRFQPDILFLGGFMKWYWVMLKWLRLTRMKDSKVAFMGEPLRYTKSERDASDSLMTEENSPSKVKMLRKLFGGADLYLGMGKVAADQFREELKFPEKRVDTLDYPSDIEDYFHHPLRVKQKGDPLVILFANRLVDRYQPLLALEAFKRLSEKHGNLSMRMNNDGPLKEECIKYIEENGLDNVSFLDDIDSWNNMNLIYKDCDILVLPGTYSNGNISIIEAGASGMGVVISDKINNMENEMKDGKNCFICRPEVEDLMNCVEKYIEEPELLTEHGRLSREFIEPKRNKHTAKLYYDMFSKHGLLG